MFDKLLFNYRLRKLQIARAKLDRSYRAHISQLRAAKASQEQLGAIHSEASFELRSLDEQIDLLQQTHLHDQAQRYLVAWPEFSQHVGGKWVQCEDNFRWRLTRAAMAELREALRAEEKAQFDRWSRWVPIGSAIVSALIGVLSLVVAILALRFKGNK